MLLPYYMNYNNSKNIDKSIKKYKNTSVDNSYLLREAEEYNKELTEMNLVDSFTDENYKEDDNYFKILNLDKDGMMGYIEIPKIGVKLPIYHTTNSDVMEKGAGHKFGTSFPVGGKGTHAVIAAHRGLPSSKLFTDLNLIDKGDIFYVHVLNKKLAYKVNQIKVVKPSNTKDIKLYKDKDYVTLITCTPYSINTHRLLVRGERIPLTDDNKTIKKAISTVDLVFYGSIIIVIILCGIFIYKISKNVDKKKKKTQKKRTVTKKKEDKFAKLEKDTKKESILEEKETNKKEDVKVDEILDKKEEKEEEIDVI